MRRLIVALLAGSASAKVVDGVARLSSQDTEIYLTKFSFSPRVQVRVNGSFHTDERDYLDNHPHALTLCLYSDSDWPKFLNAMKRGSLCKERQLLATWSTKVSPVYDTQPKGAKPMHKFEFDAHVATPKQRAHYWFAMVMDCYLEARARAPAAAVSRAAGVVGVVGVVGWAGGWHEA
jgi:hypothetical protein